MTYQQTIDYLYHKLPMFSRMGSAALKKDLTNTRILCERLHNPQNKFKSIHIAGTNGKGSVSHMLAAILQTAGYKTGLYTSPHLHDFRERIKINGHFISEQFVIDFVQKVQPIIEEIQPSFFEITVALAFDYFAQQNVDVAVVEVGLGGRLDSTNIITPEVSIITNIGLDHVTILGNTLPEIAAEKAGIIKENIPVVIGERNKETENVFKQIASEKNAPIFFAEDELMVENFHPEVKQLEVSVFNKLEKSWNNYQLDLPGIYQTKNILPVLKAVKLLQQKNWQITAQHLSLALQNVKKLTGLHGRWEVIREYPTVVLEVAHNEDGIKQMLNHLQHLSFNQLRIVLGVVKDKDLAAVLKLLPNKAIYYFTQADIPRALDKNVLQAEAAVYNKNGESFTNVNSALHRALSEAAANDLIIVCGSIFLVAEVEQQLIEGFEATKQK